MNLEYSKVNTMETKRSNPAFRPVAAEKSNLASYRYTTPRI